MSFRTLDQADLANKRVLLRVDLNVPMADGKVSDATRIERVAPTIKELSAKGAKVILLAHFGRPKGEPVADQSLSLTAPGKAERSLSRGELSQAIMDAQSKNPEQPVLIVGDKNVKYEAVLSVMDELKRLEVKRVSLLVQPTGK